MTSKKTTFVKYSPIVEPAVIELMSFWGDSLNEMEGLRMATANRYRTMTGTDEYGHGLPKAHPGVVQMNELVEELRATELQLVKNLQRVMKDHPLYEWVKNTKGVGLKTSARYIVAVGGDVAWHSKEERVRTLRELWSYSGLGVNDGVAPTRRRGVQANWSDSARMRVWNMAQPMIRGKKSAYRYVYDDGRTKYDGAKHAHKCVRCGPQGKPALEDSDLGLGHQHARATRLVMKEITKDMWEISYALHQDSDAHLVSE